MDMITLAMAKKHTDSYFETKATTLLSADLADGVYHVEELIGLKPGETYTVVTDSGKYTSVCKQLIVEDLGEESTVNYFGNGRVLGLEDTGESYLVVDFGGDGATVMDANGGTHLEVIHNSKNVAPQFIPNYIPLVEIADTAALTAEENAALTACMGSPILVKHMGQAFLMNWLGSTTDAGNTIYSFVCSMMGSTVWFTSKNGVTWEYGAQ